MFRNQLYKQCLSFIPSRDIYVWIFHYLLEILRGSVICQRKEGPRKDEQSLVAHCPFFSYSQVARQYGKERLMLTLIQACSDVMVIPSFPATSQVTTQVSEKREGERFFSSSIGVSVQGRPVLKSTSISFPYCLNTQLYENQGQ